MATIARLLQVSEASLNSAIRRSKEDGIIGKEIKIAQVAALLAIARSLNHIVDHGVSYGTLPMLKINEKETSKDK